MDTGQSIAVKNTNTADEAETHRETNIIDAHVTSAP